MVLSEFAPSSFLDLSLWEYYTVIYILSRGASGDYTAGQGYRANGFIGSIREAAK